jgi:hypothetical protein
MTSLIQRLYIVTALITLLFAFVFLGTVSALGQATSTGTVVGVVTDQTGAVVAGAAISLTDSATGSFRTTTSNGVGQYVMVNVPPGDYTVKVSKSGFSVSEIKHQTVSVGTQATVDVKLTLGANETTVEVTAATSADLQTLNATIGSTVDSTAINGLPSLGRDVSTFATLQPGVTPDGSVAGTAVDQVTMQLDGGNNSSDMDGSMTVYTGAFAGNPTGVNAITANGSPSGVMPMPADSVEEFKVNTANQTADFNNSSGAQVEVVTKRGTNRVHGTVYEYYLDNNFDANTWDNRLSGTPKPSYHYNRFGAALGGPVLPTLLGGKTYLFGNYEGYRFPNSQTFERAVPSANLRNGIVTFNGTAYNLKTIDPRGIGINPTVKNLWNTYEPVGNDPSCGALLGSSCDGTNEIGFKGNVNLPTKSDFGVVRLDHDFGAKWHFMTSYRYFKLTLLNTSQVDIGGLNPGDKLGVPTSLSSRPQDPWYYVAGLTTNINSTTTNDFHYSYLRNVWSWSDAGAPPLSGLGGALEPLGESNTKALVPINVDTQDIRTRFWDGHDHFLRDDVTKLKGSHLVQFGGQYQHNFNYHQRTDNGGGINYTTTYQLGDSAGSGLVKLAGLQAAGYPTTSTASRVASAALGIVTDSQVAYTRVGNALALNPPLTPASDKVTIPYYNVYFSDTWHMKPTFTLTYGLGWTLEMPPTEATGKQVALVDASAEPIEALDYLAQRKAAALNGQVYNPTVGFALVGNVGSGLKYPFNPFYGSFSPRVGAAWNPHVGDGFLGHILGGSSTVIRGGYGRIYGRLNGVGLVLTPLLGAGLIQPVQCRLALAAGGCGPATPTDSTAFRIGVDGNTAPLQAASPTLPQPLYPGINSISSATGSVLDPHFRPNDVDSFDLTIQRQITSKTLVEVGYIGRLIHHEFQPLNLTTVPYMMSLGGQSFASAYAALETGMGCATSAAQCGANGAAKIAPQPFFETALAGTGYCTGYANCTAAVATKEFSNLSTQSVWSMWSDMDNGGFNFPRSMMNTPIAGAANGSNGQISSGVSLATATGYGNYNGGFVTFKVTDWHGVTLQENFTYSKALGTGSEVQATSEYTPNDAFNLNSTYGVQPFNRKFVFNTFIVWQTPWYSSQRGFVGRALGGWTFAPIFSSGSGSPLYCNTFTDAQSFGGGDGSGFFDNEQCVFTSTYKGGNSTHRGVSGGTDSYGNDIGTAVAGTGHAAINMFSNPVSVFSQVRAPILGIDTKNPGVGPITGLPYWNMDMSIRKNLKVMESANLEFSGIFTNIFNHNDFGDPTLDISNPSAWGVVTAQGNAPRKIQFGVRIKF